MKAERGRRWAERPFAVAGRRADDDFVLNNLFQAGEPLDYTLLQFSAAWLEQGDVRLPRPRWAAACWWCR
ncbi:hypothetical protein M8494_25340 [Serratia ureilytica]